VPLEHLRHFVSLDVRRRGQELQVESLEVIAPVNQRGNRGGKGRRGGGERSRSGGGRPEGGRPAAAGAAADAPRGVGPGPGLHRSAISRPSR
jgi:hypothetical protein